MENNIDWEARRYEIAKDLVGVILSKFTTPLSTSTCVIVRRAVGIADALVEELQKPHKKTETD